MKTLAVALSTLAFAFSHQAQAQGFGRGTAVVYGNGMLNADGEWNDGIRRIKVLNLDRDLDVLGKVSYDVAINRSEYKVNGISKDGLEEFYEVAAQKLGELAARKYWLWLSRSELLPLELQQDYIRIASNVMSNPVAGDVDLSAHVAKYKAYMSGGSRVLLVSHSQGNLYANQAWNSLFGARRNSVFVESLGNVQVATPASLLSAGQILRLGQSLGAWQTFPDDLVIAGVRATFGALPANLPQEGRIGDPALGHNFVKAYMRSGSTALTRVVADMKNVARVLVYPIGISDLSAAASDSAALADLINDANNLSPTPVEPGKALYLEGSGLGGAQFVVPGVTARLTASAVNLPTDHPLYVAGSEVWKLSIPANAVVGSSGVIRAIIDIDGVEQSLESPRQVTIKGLSVGFEYKAFFITKSGFPEGIIPLPADCSALIASGYRIDQLWNRIRVERVEYFSGIDAGKVFEKRVPEAGCGSSGEDMITQTVLNQNPQFDEPGNSQATYSILYVTNTSPNVSSFLQLYGDVTYRRYKASESSPGNCDISRYSSRYRATSYTSYDGTSGAEVTFGGEVNSLGTILGSCNEGLIMSVRNEGVLTTN